MNNEINGKIANIKVIIVIEQDSFLKTMVDQQNREGGWRGREKEMLNFFPGKKDSREIIALLKKNLI